MKTFEERKADVMERSRARIRRRNRLIRGGTTLAALAVCAVVGGLLWKPAPPVAPEDGAEEMYMYAGNASEDKNGATANRGDADGTLDVGSTVLQTNPTVECMVGNRLRFWSGDEATVRFALLTDAMATQPTNADITVEEPADAPEEPTLGTTAEAVRITTRMSPTDVRVWTLEENRLSENGVTVTLSDEMLKTLKDAFDLP
ncbi:MAG: hypothetical protein IJD01_01420 [Clostridia bacterium]|nr:hypothetical protein [Clostridia bacterium]